MDFKTKKIKIFYILNIIVPILIGALVYYAISPNTLFVEQIDEAIAGGFHASIIEENYFLQFIRNYFPDMLWGYALVYALCYINGGNTAGIKRMLIIAFVFSAVIEILQLASFSRGTFDVFDVVAEFLAEIAAVFIIRKHTKEEKKYENKK